jgi:hypothetical protein
VWLRTYYFVSGLALLTKAVRYSVLRTDCTVCDYAVHDYIYAVPTEYSVLRYYSTKYG